MTRRKKDYNAGSVWHALELHRQAGALQYLSILDDAASVVDGSYGPEPSGSIRITPTNADDLTMKTKFRVKPYGYEYLDLSVEGAHTLVLGLTSAKKFYADRERELDAP